MDQGKARKAIAFINVIAGSTLYIDSWPVSGILEEDSGSRTGRYVVVMLPAALRATVRVDYVHDQAVCCLTVSPLISFSLTARCVGPRGRCEL